MTTYYQIDGAPFFQFFNESGNLQPNLLLWTYQAGSTTPVQSYTDETGGTPNSNPILLASNGRLPNVSIWVPGGTYLKCIVTTNAGTPSVPAFGAQIGNIYDNLQGVNDPTAVLATVAATYPLDVFYFMSADSTPRQSTVTLAAEPGLTTGNLIAGTYAYELFLRFDSAASAAGFAWGYVGTALMANTIIPALTYGFVDAASYGPKNESPYGVQVTYANVSTVAGSNTIMNKGSLIIGTPGTFSIGWCQASSTASNTTIRRGSYLSLITLIP